MDGGGSWSTSAPVPGAPNTQACFLPAEQLVAGRRDQRGAPAQHGRGVGLVGQQGMRGEQARPDVGDDGHAEIGQLADVAGAGEPASEVRRVHLEHERGVLADGPGVIGAGDPVRGADFALLRVAARSSGMRKPSPISTSSPRATTISRPCARAIATSASAAAPLFATCAAAAAGTAASSAPTAPAPRGPRSPVARSSSTSQVPVCHHQRRAGRVGQRRPPEVRVQQHAGGVEDRAQGGGGGGQRVERGVDDLRRRQDTRPDGLLRGADRGLDPFTPQPGGGVGQPEIGQHRVGAGTPRRGSTSN